MPRRELVDLLDRHEVPVGPIYSIEDIFEDSHYRERGSLVDVVDPVFGKVSMPAIVPLLSKTPGRIKHPGPPELGSHNEEILGGMLEYTAEQLADLRERGVI